MNQQMVFQSIKHMAEKSECTLIQALVHKQWFSGYDYNAVRMLPDGTTIPGAPFAVDLSIRNEIVSEILDGLKTRPRGNNPEPRSLFALELYEYDLCLALCQAYEKAEEFINARELDPYVASSFETMVYTLMHVARMETYEVVNTLHRPLDEGDYQNCEI